MFVASGKILQSRYIRTKGCFRLYCAVLVSRQDKSRMNHVLYSDDFGKSWNVLEGVRALLRFLQELTKPRSKNCPEEIS